MTGKQGGLSTERETSRVDDEAPPSRFLERWSRRKAARADSDRPDSVSAGWHGPAMAPDSTAPSETSAGHTVALAESELEPGVVADVEPGDTGPAPAELTDTEPVDATLTDADMPAIETLDGKSDLSGFFSEGVSAELRRRAWRQVFSQPVFNLRDGLNDYDGDYTVFEPLGDTVTADMKFHAARKEAARRLQEEEEAVAAGEFPEHGDDSDVEPIAAVSDDDADLEADAESGAEDASVAESGEPSSTPSDGESESVGDRDRT